MTDVACQQYAGFNLWLNFEGAKIRTLVSQTVPSPYADMGVAATETSVFGRSATSMAATLVPLPISMWQISSDDSLSSFNRWRVGGLKSMLNTLKRFYLMIPESVRGLIRFVPPRLRFGRTFYRTQRLLKISEFWEAERHKKWQLHMLIKLCLYAKRYVPFYRKLFKKHKIRPEKFKSLDYINDIPPITKKDVQKNLEDLISRAVPFWQVHTTATGGSTGRPFVFLLDDSAVSREWAFIFYMWRRVGYSPYVWKATLRGVPFLHGRLYVVNPFYNEVVLSPFQLSPSNAGEYLRIISRFSCRYIHGYPSAITVLARYLIANNLPPPQIKAVLACSENIYSGQRELIEDAFHTRFFSWYGMSEKVVLAGECEHSSLYHCFPQYGITQILAKDGTPINEPGVRGEIVGTGFINWVVPFIRYRTEDYAEFAEGVCRCGRQFPLIKDVQGRWHQEMLVGKTGTLVSVTALNMHSPVFKNVARLQFVQEVPGKVLLRVVPLPTFGRQDRSAIIDALKQKVSDEIVFDIHIVDETELTPVGKGKLVVQNIKDDDFFRLF